jgi:hypothetical protein
VKAPSRDFVLAGGLICPSREIDRGVWQEHVVKHPLGVNALARSSGRDRWNVEGWDTLAPAVISESERAQLVAGIGALSEGKIRCEVPELRGKKTGSKLDRLACRDCQPPVVAHCSNLMNGPNGIGTRYRDVTESLLAELTSDTGVQVEPARLPEVLTKLWRTPESLAGLVVLTIGLDDHKAARPIARISRGDGVRAEFYLEEPNILRWRTAYRAAAQAQTGPQRVSFLRDVPRPAPGIGRLSELCVVARRWWEAHGI